MQTYRSKERVQAQRMEFDGQTSCGIDFKKGDFVVRNNNGSICFYTEEEFNKLFEIDECCYKPIYPPRPLDDWQIRKEKEPYCQPKAPLDQSPKITWGNKQCGQ